MDESKMLKMVEQLVIEIENQPDPSQSVGEVLTTILVFHANYFATKHFKKHGGRKPKTLESDTKALALHIIREISSGTLLRSYELFNSGYDSHIEALKK